MTGTDEIEPPELHLWLCACRQLMFERPADGAWLDRPVFVGSEPPRPGWNKQVFEDGRQPSYLFIDPVTMHAQQTPFRPANMDETTVHVVHHAVPGDARETDLWIRASGLGSNLPRRLIPPGVRKPKLTMATIARYAQLPRKTEAIMTQVTPLLKSLFDRVDFGSGTGPDPALRVAAKYMSFDIPGIIARYLLSSVYLEIYTTVPQRFHRRCAPARTMLMRKVEDLSDAAYRLFRARTEFNVAGFFNATYLASLFAGTVITMGSDAGGRLERLEFNAEERDRLRRLRQNADELAAHYLSPAFSLPAQLRANGILGWVRNMAALQGKTPLEMAEEQCLHPGLSAVLVDADMEQLCETAVQARYVRNVAGRPNLTIADALRREEGALRVNLHAFLLH